MLAGGGGILSLCNIYIKLKSYFLEYNIVNVTAVLVKFHAIFISGDHLERGNGTGCLVSCCQGDWTLNKPVILQSSGTSATKYKEHGERRSTSRGRSD
jgi:hypothetical protein